MAEYERSMTDRAENGESMQLSDPSSRQAQLDALKSEIAGLTRKAQGYVNNASESVSDTAAAGVSRLESSIRRNPGIAMATAVSVGVALALIISHRSSTPTTRLGRARHMMPNMDDYRIDRLSSSIERAVDRATPRRESIASLGDRFANAMNDMEIRKSLGNTADQVMSWWGDAKNKVASKL